MEVEQTPASPPTQTQHCSSTQEEALYKSLQSLNASKQYEACRSTALTIESLFKDHLPPLVKLFEFYQDNDLLDMALNLFSNIIVKNFDLSKPTEFDTHLFNMARAITNQSDEFLKTLFSRLNANQQEKVVSTVLNRLKSGPLGFLKPFAETTTTAANKTLSLTRPEIIDFYSQLAANLDSVRLVKELLVVAQPKLIHDHGIYMIDAFLNAEKHVFAAMSSLEVERRSLNVMRRLCVCEFIPCFVRLCVDKLDNRHCYRWIEKSLEFFTKYTIAAIRVHVDENDKSVGFRYEPVNLLNESEIAGQQQQEETKKREEREQLERIKRDLKELIEYKNETNDEESSSDLSSPFYKVYTLLNELGKKLEWPVTSSSHASWPKMDIEQKMALLFEIKHKTVGDPKSISMSALNKQISFYGLAFFFHKLIEFQAYSAISSPSLILAPLFDSNTSTSTSSSSSKPIVIECYGETSRLLENFLANLAFTLELWRKFNQHKEWMTIITKCLNNSKSDGIAYYKSFIADYYNSYLLGLSGSAATSLNFTWANVGALPLKRRFSALAYLFINEKSSFKSFFNEFNRLLNELKEDENQRFNASLVFFKANFDLFEPNKINIIKYMSKLFGEKLNQLIENKRAEKTALLSKREDYVSMLLVLLQPSLDRTANSNVYQTLFQLIVAKSNFSWPHFFDYIYDIQILQDFFMVVNSSAVSFQSLQLSSSQEKEDKEAISKKILAQVNCPHEPKLSLIPQFFTNNLNTLITLFDHLV